MALLSTALVNVPDAADILDIAPVRYREMQRAVSEHIGLGAWCDSLAWDSLFDEQFRLDIAKIIRTERRRRQPKGEGHAEK